MTHRWQGRSSHMTTPATTLVYIGIPRLSYERGVRGLVVIALALVLALGGASTALAGNRSVDRVDGVTPSELGIPKAAMPDVTMDAGVLVSEDGRVLWSRHASHRRAMASITKVMTAVIAMENGNPDDMVTIPKDSTSVGESTSFLRAGEKLAMSEVLEGLLVKSGNDAAVAVAEHVSGTESEFVKLMNAKAAALGLKDTHFKNAHGLDEKGHYSTAADLAVLSRYAMTKPQFREIVAEKTARIGSGKRSDKVQSTKLLLGNYAGSNGVKTGWTNDAGYCVIDSASRAGVELHAVVLGTTGEAVRFRDARELLDFGFAHYRPQRLASAGTVIGQAPVTDFIDVVAPAAVSEDTTVPIFDLAGPISRTVTVTSVAAPVKRGQRIGVATFTQQGNVIASVPLVAMLDVAAPSPMQRVGIALLRVWRKVKGEPTVAAPVGALIFAASGVSY